MATHIHGVKSLSVETRTAILLVNLMYFILGNVFFPNFTFVNMKTEHAILCSEVVVLHISVSED